MQENGMSLKQLMRFLWLSLKKSIIFIIIGIFVVSALLFSVRQVSTVSTYRTEIVFKKPMKDALSEMNANKAYAVNEAMEKTEKPLTLSNEITKNLSVTAVVPETVESLEDYIPTAFEVTLKPSKDLDLIDSEYKVILDAISVSYINLFAQEDISYLNLNYDVESRLGNEEYIQIANELYERANTVLTGIKNTLDEREIKTSYGNLQGKSFDNIITNLESEIRNLNLIQFVISSNKVETDKKAFKSYMQWNITNLDAKIERYTLLLTTAQKNLEDYNVVFNSQVNNAGGSVYVLDSNVFMTLNDQIIKYSEILTEAEEMRKIKAEQLSIFENATENSSMKPYVEAELKESQANLLLSIEDYKELVDTYNQNKYLESDAKLVKPAYELKESAVSMIVIVICALATAILIYTIACIKVYPKFKETELEKEETANKSAE